ncbi:yjaB [Symbiodinium necroappetens]|uniref:YjaB protein n=2 Tax=Symbiodinium TaxID=2949 RepID=A0A812RIF0_9DINO|nr:putative N-acetyltransferase YjaB [Symbiodinium microadriaticum]CAE7438788.1 yjaB [Symbiodinium necroappetens]CAE7893780.1 yjaB [Symbiodinium microadriaticum]CAE7939098.1 yjaB [Symbiodinium sp. KB8]
MDSTYVIRKARRDEEPLLFDLWHASVRATHSFLSEEALAEIAMEVKTKFLPNVEPDVIVDATDRPMGFMVMTGDSIDALFVDAGHRGQGLGTLLMDAAKSGRTSLTLEVNEQNTAAWAFYHRCGFTDSDRRAQDDAGRPFPLIVMKWTRQLPLEPSG